MRVTRLLDLSPGVLYVVRAGNVFPLSLSEFPRLKFQGRKSFEYLVKTLTGVKNHWIPASASPFYLVMKDLRKHQQMRQVGSQEQRMVARGAASSRSIGIRMR